MECILFYSNRCKYSNDILKKLKQENILEQMESIVCIDKIPRDKIPSYLNTVPSLLIPDYDQPLDYKMILNWINTNKQQQMQPQIQEQQPQTQEQEPQQQKNITGMKDDLMFMGYEDNNINSFETLDADINTQGNFVLSTDDPEMGKLMSDRELNFAQREVDNKMSADLEKLEQLRSMDDKLMK
jgi:predicted transposase YbfD/YdcC